MPRLQRAVSMFVRRSSDLHAWRCRLVYLVLMLACALPALPLQAAPARPTAPLSLPTPPGETWRVLQGYACGSHNGWDRYSLDLVNNDGRTFGAPIRAAADGVIFVWTRQSGTLILHHGDGFYTMYTHLDSVVSTESGKFIGRGTVIGTAGERATPGTPHLHFTAFTAEGTWARNRRSVPLSFLEGYDLPETGGCNQHGGKQLVANSSIAFASGLAFSTSAEPGRWYNRDLAIEFGGAAATRGLSYAWGTDPGSNAPALPDTVHGVASLAASGEGLHTLFVRGWDSNGQQTLATFGPVGFDVTPPQPVALPAPIQIKANQPAPLQWQPANDNGSGVAGYRIYIGADPAGTSEWFVPGPQVDLPALASGDYLLRAQALDYAGNLGEWVTLGQIRSV